ncbi:MAG: MFS transporter [Bifidobacterium sp.]|nr:MFS transporter [Bifidobacterium sp.]
MKRFMALQPAFRWLMLGFVFSNLGNAAFEGGWVPAVLIAGLPTWVVAFRSTFGTVSDFMSPIAGYVVDRCGSFNSLAFAEGLEGVLCLGVGLVPESLGCWKWLLLALACSLLVTGQVIDVAGEVFQVDAADGDDDMLIRYSSLIAIVASLTGSLVGGTLGAALAAFSLQILLFFSAAASLACAATRFATRHVINRDVDKEKQAHAMASAASAEPNENDSVASADATLQSQEDTTAQRQEAPSSAASPDVSMLRQISLLVSSGMLAFIPAVWISYSILGLGRQFGKPSMSMAYAFFGVGGVAGSFMFAGISRHLTMRNAAVLGIGLTACGLAVQLAPMLYAILAGMLITSLGRAIMVQPVILSRQLLMRDHGLARFTGYARFAYACASAAGSWIGWLFADRRQLLLVISMLGCLVFLAVVRSLVNVRPAAKTQS